MSAPKVSVVVPIYNVGNYVEKSLKSLQNQSLQDIEVLCLNNGSEDDSALKADRFSKSDSRFILINAEKIPIGTLRNKGISMARGDYIAFMDSDDTFERNALEELYNQAKSQKDDMVIYNYQKMDDKYRPIAGGKRSIAASLRNGAKISDMDTFDWKKIRGNIFGLGNSFWAAWSKFYDAKFLKQNNIHFSDYDLCEDHVFTVESLLKAKKIGYREQPIYNYLVRPGSASRRIAAKNSGIFEIFKEMKKMISDLNLEDELAQEYNEYLLKTMAFVYKRVIAKKQFEADCRKILTEEDFKKLSDEFRKIDNQQINFVA